MEFWELVDQVDSKESFLRFMEVLRADWHGKHELVRRSDGADTKIRSGPWENCYLPDFLEAMQAWVEDTSRLPADFPFNALADILTASTMYE
jgi:hypothetical protein